MRKVLSGLLVLSLLLWCSLASAMGETNADAYENAIGLLRENKYAEAGKAFSALGGYSDAPRYSMYCSAIAAGESGLYSIAVDNLKSLDGFMDSTILATYYAGLSWESIADYEHALELFNGISLYRDVASRISGYPALINARDYRMADEYEKAGKLDEAYSGFLALGTYEDSADRAASLKARIDERDAAAAEEANAAAYAQADQAEKDGRYEEAYAGFTALGDYSDSKDRAASVQQRAEYAKGMSMISVGSYKDAYYVFKSLGDFEDSSRKAYALGLVDFAEMRLLDATTASFRFHDKYGIINFISNNVTIPQWDGLSFVAENCLKFQSRGLYGLVSCDGTELSPAKWYDLSKASDDVVVAAIQEKDATSNKYSYTYCLVDCNGTALTPAYKTIGKNGPSSNSSIALSAPQFSSGLIRVQSADEKWGFINSAGEVKIPISFSEASDFSNELAAVKDGQWGYINDSGEFMIPPQFAAALDFNENDRAEVRSRKSWHVIDKSGSIVYFEGQPFDQPPADGESGANDKKLEALNALAEYFGMDPDNEDLLWLILDLTYGMDGIDSDALEAAAEKGDIDAALDAIDDLSPILEAFGLE